MEVTYGEQKLETKIYYERVPIFDSHGKVVGVRPTEYTGRTFAIIWDGTLRHVGISRCSPRDQFSRPYGRMVATKRAGFAKEIHDHDNVLERARPGFEKNYTTGDLSNPSGLHSIFRDIPADLLVQQERKPRVEKQT